MENRRDIGCETCQDTFWIDAHCPGDRTCGRPWTHAPHPYTKPCGCRAFNRGWLDRIEKRRPSA